MSNQIKWRSKILLAKIETTYGVDPVPATANGILGIDVEIQPMEGNDESRNIIQAYLGGQEDLPTSLHAILTYSTELTGSGTAGTAPAWGPMLRACGLAEVIVAATSVTYNPISDNMESISHYFWVGDTRHVITGCRGTAELTVNAQGIPAIRWTFTGLFQNPTEVSRVTPTLTGFKKPKVATTTNTPTFNINGVSLVMRNFSLNFNNEVEQRLLIGKEEILIVDRAEEITTQVEAVPLTTFDPFTLAGASTSVALNLVHGTVAGEIVTLAAPTCRVQRPSSYTNEQGVLEWPLNLKALPNAGNDQFTLALT